MPPLSAEPAVDPGSGSRSSRRFPAGRLAGLLLALCVGAVTIDGGFVFDDRAALLENPIVQGRVGVLDAFSRSVWGEPIARGGISSYRPLSPLLWRAVWALFDGRPLAYRVLSLVLHTLAVALFWRLGRALGTPEGPLAAAAAIFAVHPVHAESVSWVAGVTDLACAAFYLALCFPLSELARMLERRFVRDQRPQTL